MRFSLLHRRRSFGSRGLASSSWPLERALPGRRSIRNQGGSTALGSVRWSLRPEPNRARSPKTLPRSNPSYCRSSVRSLFGQWPSTDSHGSEWAVFHASQGRGSQQCATRTLNVATREQNVGALTPAPERGCQQKGSHTGSGAAAHVSHQSKRRRGRAFTVFIRSVTPSAQHDS